MKGLDKVRQGADVDEVLEEVVAARRAGTDPKEMFGGPRDWVDAALPAACFLLGNAVGGVRAGIVAALVAMAGVFVVRLVRRETLRHAFSGVIGVVISALLARRLGAKGFFLKDIVVNGVYGAAFLLSVVLRHPLVGVIMRVVLERPKQWHEHPAVRRAYAEVTLAWSLLFLLRLAVQVTFYRLDRVGWLGATKIAMGYPLFVGLMAATMPYINWRTRDVPVPESADEDETEAGGDDAADAAADEAAADDAAEGVPGNAGA